MAEFRDNRLDFIMPVKKMFTTKSIEYIKVLNVTETSFKNMIMNKDCYNLNGLINAENAYPC